MKCDVMRKRKRGIGQFSWKNMTMLFLKFSMYKQPVYEGCGYMGKYNVQGKENFKDYFFCLPCDSLLTNFRIDELFCTGKEKHFIWNINV